MRFGVEHVKNRAGPDQPACECVYTDHLYFVVPINKYKSAKSEQGDIYKQDKLLLKNCFSIDSKKIPAYNVCVIYVKIWLET